MKVFVDTNVVIDLLLQRDDYLSVGMMLQQQKDGKHILMVSSLTIVNLVYIMRKQLFGQSLYRTLGKLMKHFSVVDVTAKHIDRAIELGATDFEDAVQFYSACDCSADVIVTRNKKDYKFSTLPVISTKELISIS